MSQGAREQAALGIRLQEPTAAPHQQKQSVRMGYSPVKGQAEQRCAALLTSREGGPESKMVEVAAMTLKGKIPWNTEESKAPAAPGSITPWEALGRTQGSAQPAHWQVLILHLTREVSKQDTDLVRMPSQQL